MPRVRWRRARQPSDVGSAGVKKKPFHPRRAARAKLTEVSRHIAQKASHGKSPIHSGVVNRSSSNRS